MSSNSNKRESLLTQLENMHKQLNEEYEVKSGQPNTNELTQTAGIRRPNLFSNVLSRREKTNPMPMFAGSAAHNGVLTANNGKDMSFVMGLSENLLVECRRLQAENQKKTNRVKSIQEEFDQLDEKHKKLDSFHQITSKELTALRDTNWELEVKVQQFSVELKELKDKLNKSRKELKSEQEASHNIKAELEVSTLQRSGLGKELIQREKEYFSEVTDLKKHISQLNDENDSLYIKLKTLDQIATNKEILEVELSQCQTLADKLRQQISDLEAKNKETGDGKALQSELSQSRNEANELRIQVTDLEAKSKLNGDGKVLQSELSESRKVIEELRQRLTDLEMTKATTDKGMGNKRTRNKARSKDIEECSDAENDISRQMDAQMLPENLEGELTLDSGLHMPLVEVKKYAKLYNMKLIPEIEYSSADLGRKKDSGEQLVNTVGDTNLLALPNDNSSLKNSIDESTSIESMIKRLESSGYKVLPFPKFNEEQQRLKELEDPSENYLMSKVGDFGKVLVSQDAYDKMKHPSASQLKINLEKLGFTVMSNDEYKTMLDLAENPDIKYLEDKLAAKNQVAISKKDYKQYIAPDAEFIKDRAESIGYVVITEESYDDMNKRIAHPTIDTILNGLEKLDFREILHQFGQKHCLVLLEKQEHDKLVSTLENPSRKYLEEKCPMQGMKPLQLKEYNKLLQNLEHPTVQYMNEKAACMNRKLIPLKTYEKLQQTFESPPLDFIRQNATKNGFTLLSEDDHNSMKKALEEPDIKYLEAKVNAQNQKVIDLKLHDLLTQTFDNPSLEFLIQKASAKGYDVLGTKSHQELLRKATHPTEAEIAKLAQGLGSTLVQVQEYENLKSIANAPSKNFIMEKASEINLIVIQKEEYEKFKKSVTDKDYLLSSVKGLGFVPIPAGELTALKGSTLNNSKLIDIEKKLDNLGYVAVPTEQFRDLNKPVVDRVTKEETLLLCSKFFLRPISIDEYQKMKDDSEPTVYSEDELIAMLKSHGYTVLAEGEYDRITKTIDSPTVDFIERHADRYEKVLVGRKEYEKQLGMLAHPALEYLKEKASNLGYQLENEKELEELRKLNSPSLEYLEQKADSLSMTLIPKDKYQRLLNDISNPSLAFLQTKSAAMRKHVIDNAEYGELQRKTSFPTLEEVVAYAGTLNMVVVVKDEQDNLLKRIDQPTFDYLEKSLEKCKYVPVPLAEYNSLKMNFESPSADYLSEKSALKGMLVLSKTEYENHIERLNNPSEEELAEKAKKYSKVLASKSEVRTLEQACLLEGIEKGELQVVSQRNLAELKQTAENPSPAFMKTSLESLNYIVLNGAEFEEIKRRINYPHLGELAQHAKTQGYVLVRSRDLASKATTDTEDLNSLTEDRSFVLLNPEEYDGLLNVCVEKISKKAVTSICQKSGLIPVSSSENEKLAALRDVSKFKEYASDFGMVVISREEYDSMVVQIGKPSKQSIEKFAEDNNFLLLEKSNYDMLIDKIDNPSTDQLREQAEKLGFIILLNDEYNTLLEKRYGESFSPQSLSERDVLIDQKENETTGRLQESTREANVIQLTHVEYEKLLSNQRNPLLTKSDIYSAAEGLDLNILPTEEYKTLLSRKSGSDVINYEDLQELAARFGLGLIPVSAQAEHPSTSQINLMIENSSGDSQPKHNSGSVVGSLHAYSSDGDGDEISSPHKTGEHGESIKDEIPFTRHGEEGVKDKTAGTSNDDILNVVDLKQMAAAQGLALVPISKYGQRPKKQDSLEEAELSHEEDVEDWYDAETFEKNSSGDVSALEKRAGQFGLALIPNSIYQEYLASTKKEATKETVTEKASQLGLAVLDQETFKDLSSGASESQYRIKQLAQQFGYHVCPEEEYTLLKEQSQGEQLTSDNIHTKAKEFGYQVLTEEEFEELKNTAIAGTQKLTKEKLQQKATEYGLIILTRESYEELRSRPPLAKPCDISSEELKNRASALGLVTLSNSTYRELISKQTTQKLTREELDRRASQLGLVLLSASCYEELTSRKEPLTKEALTAKAQKLGLTVVPTKVFDNLTSRKFSEEALVSSAQKMGLKVLSEEQYSKLQKEAKAQRAARNKRVVESHTEVNSSPDLTRDQVINASEKFGLVAVEKKKYVRLTRPELLKERAQAANMICLPRSAMVASPASYKSDPNDVVVLPTAYYKRLLSKEATAIAKRKQLEHSAGREIRSTVQAVPREKRSVNSLRSTASNRSIRRDVGTASPRSISAAPGPSGGASTPMARDKSVGALSLNTIESLDEPQIIPALTQTVIGEYLYKYYQVLGLGQESRHERYFWIHPYTMTLYWSPTNPVLESSTDHRAKCASIVSVDSVADPNGTQGLYNKLLVITTDSRVIKIACPTRQRHNVWYNSLRYLIQRSMLGINLEDIAENPSDSMYTGKIFPLSKQPLQKLPRSRSLSLLKSSRH